MKTLFQRAFVHNSGIAFFPVIPNPGFIGVRDLLYTQAQQQMPPRLRHVRNDMKIVDRSLDVNH